MRRPARRGRWHSFCPAAGEHDPQGHIRLSTVLRLGILIALAAIAILLAHHFGWMQPARLAALARRLGESHRRPWLIAVFLAAYALAAALAIPITPFTLVGGALFGFWLGLALSWLATLPGSAAGYWLARSLRPRQMRAFLERHHLTQRINGASGFLAVVRLQALPPVPLAATNYAAGIAKMRFPIFLGATAIGTIPGHVVYTYFASTLLTQVAGARKDAYVHLAIAVTLLILLTLVPTMLKKLRGES